MTIVEILVSLSLCKTRNEANRKVKEGAVRVNDSIVVDPKAEFDGCGGLTIVVSRSKPMKFSVGASFVELPAGVYPQERSPLDGERFVVFNER